MNPVQVFKWLYNGIEYIMERFPKKPDCPYEHLSEVEKKICHTLLAILLLCFGANSVEIIECPLSNGCEDGGSLWRFFLSYTEPFSLTPNIVSWMVMIAWGLFILYGGIKEKGG